MYVVLATLFNIRMHRLLLPHQGYLPSGVGVVFLVGKHGVAAHISRVAGDEEAMVFDAVGHVVILTSPPPELIAEAIHSAELLHCHGTYTSKYIIVRDGHVSGLLWTCVQVTVILQQQVNIMKYEAVEWVVPQGLQGTNIHQHCSVKFACACGMVKYLDLVDEMELENLNITLAEGQVTWNTREQ
ncbi:hypothetical protein E2C01_032033 [Portunus trituberculatus]|uniref:Uncharacterized protein n=1 Tax=Portunus trituberculatus TaxID=210409 RepID=A0A5B7EYL2_PORTR|nr:hypothetical protein [Portunus trituberculatus]